MGHQQVLKNEIKQYLLSKNCEKTYYHYMEVGTNTIVVSFEDNISYPNNPSKVFLVRNSDYKVLRPLNQ